MISTDIKGRRKFGFLTAQYRDSQRPHRISCRCGCSRLIHVAAEDLTNGTVNSCGCMPPPPAFWNRQAELRQQRAREALFAAGMPIGAFR